MNKLNQIFIINLNKQLNKLLNMLKKFCVKKWMLKYKIVKIGQMKFYKTVNKKYKI